MQVDPRLEQFTALIEQQRARQSAINRSQTQSNRSHDASFGSRLQGVRGATTGYEASAEKARAAMAARNPRLAEKLGRARMLQASGTITGIESVSRTSRSVSSSQMGRVGDMDKSSPDILAVPQRPAPTPGLGMSIDTYA